MTAEQTGPKVFFKIITKCHDNMIQVNEGNRKIPGIIPGVITTNCL